MVKSFFNKEMELQFTHWIGLMIIIILFGMWVWTLKSDNDRFKAIIDKHIVGTSSNVQESMADSEQPAKRKYNPQSLD